MNWLINILQKEARRFNADDYVRYFSHPRKGKGRGVVVTPSFSRGKVVNFDQEMKKYRICDEKNGEEILVHPRNLVPDSISRQYPEPGGMVPGGISDFDASLPPVIDI